MQDPRQQLKTFLGETAINLFTLKEHLKELEKLLLQLRDTSPDIVFIVEPIETAKTTEKKTHGAALKAYITKLADKNPKISSVWKKIAGENAPASFPVKMVKAREAWGQCLKSLEELQNMTEEIYTDVENIGISFITNPEKDVLIFNSMRDDLLKLSKNYLNFMSQIIDYHTVASADARNNMPERTRAYLLALVSFIEKSVEYDGNRISNTIDSFITAREEIQSYQAQSFNTRFTLGPTISLTILASTGLQRAAAAKGETEYAVAVGVTGLLLTAAVGSYFIRSNKLKAIQKRRSQITEGAVPSLEA